jgi:ribosomal-protein-alanine N-acetyltransferase
MQAQSKHVIEAYQLFCEHRNQAWSEKLFADSLLRPFSLVALQQTPDETLLGYLMLSHVLDEAEIEDICVNPNYRHTGIATQLLVTGIDKLTQAGIKRVHLEVRQSNFAAIALYKRHDFRHIATRTNYYQDEDGEPENALIFQLTVD